VVTFIRGFMLGVLLMLLFLGTARSEEAITYKVQALCTSDIHILGVEKRVYVHYGSEVFEMHITSTTYDHEYERHIWVYKTENAALRISMPYTENKKAEYLLVIGTQPLKGTCNVYPLESS
jgi:hypothetical protein